MSAFLSSPLHCSTASSAPSSALQDNPFSTRALQDSASSSAPPSALQNNAFSTRASLDSASSSVPPSALQDNTFSKCAPLFALQDNASSSAPSSAQQGNAFSTHARLSTLPDNASSSAPSSALQDNSFSSATLPSLPVLQDSASLTSHLPPQQANMFNVVPVRTDAETYLFLTESDYFRVHLSDASPGMKSPAYTRLRYKGCPQRTFECAVLSGATKEEKMWLFRLAHYGSTTGAGSTLTIHELFQQILCPATVVKFQSGLQDADANGCLSPITFRKAFYVLTTYIHRNFGKSLSLLTDDSTRDLAQRTIRTLADCASQWNRKCTVALNQSEGERIQRSVNPTSDPLRTVQKIYALVLAEKSNFLAQFGMRQWFSASVSAPDLQRATAFAMLVLALARPTTRQEVWSGLTLAELDKALLGVAGCDAILYVSSSKNQASTGVLVIYLPSWATTFLHLYKTRVRRELIARSAWGHGSKLSLFPQNASKYVSDLFHTLCGTKLSITALRRYACLLLSRIHRSSSWFHERDSLCATAHHAILQRDTATLESYYESHNKLKREQLLSGFVEEMFVTPAQALLTDILRAVPSPDFRPSLGHHFDFAFAPASAGTPSIPVAAPPTPAAAALSPLPKLPPLLRSSSLSSSSSLPQHLGSPTPVACPLDWDDSKHAWSTSLTYSDFSSDEEWTPSPHAAPSPVGARKRARPTSMATVTSSSSSTSASETAFVVADAATMLMPVTASAAHGEFKSPSLKKLRPSRGEEGAAAEELVAVTSCLNKQRAKKCLTTGTQQPQFQLGQRNCDQCCLGYTPANMLGGSVGNGNFTPARAKFIQQVDTSSSSGGSNGSSSTSSSSSSSSGGI